MAVVFLPIYPRKQVIAGYHEGLLVREFPYSSTALDVSAQLESITVRAYKVFGGLINECF